MTETKRQCLKCGNTFPLAAYPPSRAAADGRGHVCAVCLAAVRTGPIETAVMLLRRGFVRMTHPQEPTPQ